MGIVHRVPWPCIPDYDWGLGEKWASNVQARGSISLPGPYWIFLRSFADTRDERRETGLVTVNISYSWSHGSQQNIKYIILQYYTFAHIYVLEFVILLQFKFLSKTILSSIICRSLVKDSKIWCYQISSSLFFFLMPTRQLTCAQVNFIPSTYWQHLSSQ